MKRRILLIGCALVAGLSSAAAQNNLQISGRVINGPYFDTSHRLMFSQNDYVYGTSRTAAMGGAFTSLGADLSSMNINPAGLGMYQSSDWGITQSLSINTMKTDSQFMPAGTLSSGGTRTTYGINNVSIAYNIFNRSSGLTSLTFGFGYNRMADFNSRSFVSTTGERTSIAEMFQNQLNLMLRVGKIPNADLEPSRRPFENTGIFLDEWGAVLGYQSGLVTYNGTGYSMLTGLTPTDSYFQSVTRGGIYEYTFSLGANINNILYLGATLGATQILYREDTSYEEDYSGASVRSMYYDQNTRITGAGFTMKIGAVLRPVPALRIGAAFHLPSYYTVDKSYSSEMSAVQQRNSGKIVLDEQSFNSAPRLLTGISYVIADAAILAVDYECAWYNKIRLRNAHTKDVEASRQESEDLYKPGHTIRAGLEVRASDIISVRAGGSYMFDIMRDATWVTNNPVRNNGYSISGGLGFNLGRNSYIDLTYLYNRANYTNYDFYYYDDGTFIVSQYDISGNQELSREYTPRKNHHMIMLTFGSRF